MVVGFVGIEVGGGVDAAGFGQTGSRSPKLGAVVRTGADGAGTDIDSAGVGGACGVGVALGTAEGAPDGTGGTVAVAMGLGVEAGTGGVMLSTALGNGRSCR